MNNANSETSLLSFLFNEREVNGRYIEDAKKAFQNWRKLF